MTEKTDNEILRTRIAKLLQALDDGEEVFATYCFSYPVIKNGIRTHESDAGVIGDLDHVDMVVPFAVTQNMKALVKPRIKHFDQNFEKCIKFYAKVPFDVEGQS